MNTNSNNSSNTNSNNNSSIIPNNGRVDLLNYRPHRQSSFSMNPNIKPMFEPVNQSIRNQRETSLLNTAYFSKENKEIIQNLIKAKVHKLTNQIVDKQNDIELTIIMTSIYYQYSRNDETSVETIRNEISMLNDLVADYCVKNVSSNVLQYMKYKEDISKLPEPMEHPINFNIKGEKTLMLPPFL